MEYFYEETCFVYSDKVNTVKARHIIVYLFQFLNKLVLFQNWALLKNISSWIHGIKYIWRVLIHNNYHYYWNSKCHIFGSSFKLIVSSLFNIFQAHFVPQIWNLPFLQKPCFLLRSKDISQDSFAYTSTQNMSSSYWSFLFKFKTTKLSNISYTRHSQSN